MIGILIVSHGAFGEQLIQCASHALGKCPPGVAHIGVMAADDPDVILQRAQESIGQLDEGDGVLILTDILGATPSNVAARLLRPGRIEGVSGASLPMLIRALTYRGEPLAVVVQKAISAANECTVHMESDC